MADVMVRRPFLRLLCYCVKSKNQFPRGFRKKTKGNRLTFNLLPCFSAEREGFEPPVPLSTPVFKTGVIDHSTIFPSVN